VSGAVAVKKPSQTIKVKKRLAATDLLTVLVIGRHLIARLGQNELWCSGVVRSELGFFAQRPGNYFGVNTR
jgi:hypothetical protein